jgi:hypothetical protein
MPGGQFGQWRRGFLRRIGTGGPARGQSEVAARQRQSHDDQKTRNVNLSVFHTFLSMLMVRVDLIDGQS